MCSSSDASFSPLHLLASFNFRWHFVSSSAAPSQTPLIKIFKIAHINVNFNTSILTPHLNSRVKTNLNIFFVFTPPPAKLIFENSPDPQREKEPTHTPTHPPPCINRLTENGF